MTWLRGNIFGASPEELHFWGYTFGLFRKENQQIVRTDSAPTLSACPCPYNLTVMKLGFMHSGSADEETETQSTYDPRTEHK